MKISLFIPCFIDRFYPGIGIAMAGIFERLGHEVDYPESQTCCGQPAFNTGFNDEARRVAEYHIACFRNSERVVVPSGSCGAMLRVFFPQLFSGHALEADAKALSAKTFEFSEFLVDQLKVTDTGSRYSAKATIHDGCHGLRELRIKHQPRALLRNVRDLTIVEMGEAESCCGFGGTFSVKMPAISTAMAEVKCRSILDTGADTVVSNDASCLMQIEGLLKRQGHNIRCLHLAEVLASK
jgi:L-lactate dehydrogenase complex protein LldE